MSSTVSVSVRSLLLSAALVVAVVIAYLLGTAARGSTAQAAVEPATSAHVSRTITMTGTGDATGVPDEMTFKLSVGSSAPDVSTAMDKASTTMKRAVAALRKNSVEKKDVETTGLSINPTYKYYENQSPVLTGYRVRQSIDVTVRSLRGAGRALSAAVAAGGNSARISHLGLAIGDVDGLLSRARDKAVQEATAKAEQYAKATGQDLGDVVTLKEVSASPANQTDFPQSASLALDMVRSAYKAVPIQAGSQKLDVDVSIVWELG